MVSWIIYNRDRPMWKKLIMKEIILNNQNYLLVEIPDDATNERIYIEGTLFVDTPLKKAVIICNLKTSCKIIGALSNILKDEEICKGLVNIILTSTLSIIYYESFDRNRNSFYKATDSFLSYLQSIDLDMTKQYLLIQKI